LTDTDANILASPRIRVRDKQKAKILIGDKVPVFTNSVTPTATTSVVTGTVTYLDVGIKLDVEPHVYREGDVGIAMNIEVSNIVKSISNPQSGSVAYEIGTRSAQTSLRLRDGETQILAGLINDQTTATSNVVPGIGQFPILNHLFGNENRDHSKDEIVLSITPHILRAPATAERRNRDVYAGTDASVREHPLRLDPVSAVSDSAKSSAANPAVTPGFVGGAAAGASGPALMNPGPGMTTQTNDIRAPAPRHQRPAPGTPWPPGLGAPLNAPIGQRPGDPGVIPPSAIPEPSPAPDNAPAEPAAEPAAAPEAPVTAPTPAAAPPAPAPAPTAPVLPPPVGGSITPSSN
jgi:general secretion pathway protein D